MLSQRNNSESAEKKGRKKEGKKRKKGGKGAPNPKAKAFKRQHDMAKFPAK